MSASYPALQETTFCSLINIQSNIDPAGSAQIYDAFLVMEFALPWKREVTEDDRFPRRITQAVDKAKQHGHHVRLQCVAPHPDYSRPGYNRVMYFTRPRGLFARYDKAEYVVPEEKVGALIEALLLHETSPAAFNGYRAMDDDVRDILVCTHGARDACCGKFGFDMYARLHQYCADNPGHGLRVWRASHLGGHRYAPTLLDLPFGHAWGNVTTEAVPLLVHLTGDAAQLRRHYRGWTALNTPQQQVAEAEMFRRIGWDWLTFAKTARTVTEDQATGAHVVQMEWVNPATREQDNAQIAVAIRRVVTGPASCGVDPEQWNEYYVTQVSA